MDSPENDLMFPQATIILEPQTAAYIRPASTDKGQGYAVCASDGTQLAVFATRDAAFFAAKQHELEPTLVH